MNRLLSFIGGAFIHFCVATVIALVAAVAALWFKGALDENRLYRVLAALHGLDIVTMQQELLAQEKETTTEFPSYEERLRLLTLESLDQDLRERAIKNALAEMENMQAMLEVNTERFKEIKDTYNAKLQKAADEQEAEALKEVQRTLEAIKPEQAKQQILKMLDDDAMDDVVTILKNMPIDKRKKIIGEFEQGPDADALYKILTNIREGEPLASDIKETQEKLNGF